MNISQDDPLMQRLEQVMEENDQCLQVFNLNEMRFHYVSPGIKRMFGIEPIDFYPGRFVAITHPEDFIRFNQMKALQFKVEKEVMAISKGSAYVSFTIRLCNTDGAFRNHILQAYFFHAPAPEHIIYLLQILSNVDWYKMKKGYYHHYLGNDLSLFKFPDEHILSINPGLSKREMEIIKLVELGYSSKQIAEQLFISVLTVNKHRGNILAKSGKETLIDLIHELKEQGLL